jgi:hypothetical protein
MLLDPYLMKATSGITSAEVFEAFARLYPDVSPQLDEYAPWIEAWLVKLRRKPGSALSTGRRNSLRGAMTCALLEVLGVLRPKAERNRMALAWAILDSPRGATSIGSAPELAAVRPKFQD